MRDFFRNKWFHWMAEGAFLIWGMVIMSLYFYYYPQYGFSFIWSIQIVLIAAIILAILAGMIFMALSIGEFWQIGAKQKARIIEWMRKIVQTESIRVSFLFFPAFLYVCSFIWILYIYKRSRDLSIVANDLYVLVIVTVLAVIAFSLGGWILKLFKFQFNDWLERFLLSEAIGFGTLMMVMYVLGMAHLYYRSVAYGLIFLIAIFTYREIIELWNFVKDNKVTWRIQPLISFKNFLIVAIALIVGIYTAGMFQQYPLGFDSLISYLTYPKEYIVNHRIVNFPYWIYFGFPQNGEMLFVLGLLLFNFQVALGIILIFTLLTLLLIVYLCKKLDCKSALVTGLIFLTIPVVSFQNLFDHKIEIIFSFYVVLSYMLFFAYLKEKTTKNLVVFSVVCGIASGLKYFFIGWYIAPLVVLMAFNFLKGKIKFKDLLIWASIIFVLWSPWIYKNIKFSGNPIDPIFSSQLAYKQSFYNSLGNNTQKYIVDEMRNEGLLIWDDEETRNCNFFMRLPFSVTFLNNKKYVSDGINVGVLFLLFSPLAVASLRFVRIREVQQYLFCFIFVLLLGWIYIGHLVMWYAIPIFVLCSILIAISIQKFWNYKYVRLGAVAFLSVWFLAFIIFQIWIRCHQLALFEEGAEADDIIGVSNYLNKYRDNGELIWGVDEVRGYYINRSNERFIPDNYLLAMSHLLKNNSDEKIVKFLKDKKISLFLYRSGTDQEDMTERVVWTYMSNGSDRYAKLTRENYLSFIKFKEKHLNLIYKEGGFFLYELKNE